MVEKKPTITYKKRRSPRSLKVWDTVFLFEAMQSAVHFKDKIEKVSLEKDTPIEELDGTLIDTGILYHILDAYTDAYQRLMKEALINSGNISKISPTLN